ncbi:MAG: hypothetical protein RBS99_03835 [Rhodospirillales bacterium]|nr:hypothetical protein [Rhodospirillales bacterium]
MADPGGYAARPALEVPAGHAVLRSTAGGGSALCLKGRRQAKRHIQDYTVALDPVAEGGHRLDFIDPEDVLTDCGTRLVFVAEPQPAGRGGARPHPQPGDLVEGVEGLWLAVSETNGLYRFVSFIHVATGDVRRLREATLTAVHRRWRIEAPAALNALFPGLASGRQAP